MTNKQWDQWGFRVIGNWWSVFGLPRAVRRLHPMLRSRHPGRA